MAEEIRDPYSGNVIDKPAVATTTPSSVYTTSNIQQATTTPVAAPDDLLGIRKQIMGELGVTSQQEQVNQLAQQLAAQRQTGRAQQLAIQNLPQALNVIRGEQAQAQQISATQEQALAENLNAAQSALAAKTLEAQSQFEIRQNEVQEKKNLMVQYPGAKITFGDSMTAVASKLETYQKQAEKDAYKKELKKMALSLGVKTSGSTKDIEKRISKVNKNARKEAETEAKLKIDQLKLSIASAKNKYNQGVVDPIAEAFKSYQAMMGTGGGTNTGGTNTGIAYDFSGQGYSVRPENQANFYESLINNNFNK